MCRSSRFLAALAFAAILPHAGWCEEGKAMLRVGETVAIQISSDSDDDDYRDPPGYFPPQDPVHFFNRRLELVNRSKETVSNVRLVINGNDLTSRERIFKAATAAYGDTWPMLSVWRFWTANRFHREVGTRAGADPVASLAGYGHTLCGEDALNLAALATIAGFPCRTVALNGHAAYEYGMDGNWMFLDGDQWVYCLDWDNRTPVSAEAIRKDPLLAIRTKVFGRSAKYDLAASWQNSALFERVEQPEQRDVRGVSRKEYATVSAGWTLHPGERLEFEPAGAGPLGNVILHFNPAARRDATGKVMLELPLPLREIHSGGKDLPAGMPEKWADGFRTDIPDDTKEAVAVYQASRRTMPRLKAGANSVTLLSDRKDSRGGLELRWEYQTRATIPPAPKLDPAAQNISSGGTAEKIWWQLAENGDFSTVHPNFDLVSNNITYWIPNSYDTTFLDSSRRYAVRAKVRAGGVWSDWSEPVDFAVSNPPLPAPIRTGISPDGRQITFHWPPVQAEAVICGSNRLDFIPEPLSEISFTRILNGKAREQEKNQNIAGRTNGASITIPHTFRYYRILWGKDQAWTLSPLLRPEPPAGAPEAMVLQTRHRMIGKEDEYLSELMPLPQ